MNLKEILEIKFFTMETSYSLILFLPWNFSVYRHEFKVEVKIIGTLELV